MRHDLRLPFVTGLAVALLAASSPRSSAEAAVDGSRLPPTHPAVVDVSRRLDAGEFTLFQSNVGWLGFDSATMGSGLLFPRGGSGSIVFAGGVWIGARVSGDPRVTVAEFTTEYGPGRILAGLPESPLASSLQVYKVIRFTGLPQDTAHVDRTPGELAADPTLDPVAHHSWSEYVSGAGSRGAPVAIYRLPNTASPAPDDSVDVPGPAVQGDQMTWCVFNDADPTLHSNRLGLSSPLGVEVRRTVHTFAMRGVPASTAIVEYEIVNGGVNTLQDLLVSSWVDPDLGSAANDLVGTDLARGMVFAFDGADEEPVFGNSTPAFGVMQLESLQSPLDTLYAYSSSFYGNGGGPRAPAGTYNVMLGLNVDGSTVVNPANGLPSRFMFTGDPVAGTGWRDTVPGDKRMMVTTKPKTLAPGASIRVRTAWLLAQGSDRMSSLALLRRCAEIVRRQQSGIPLTDLRDLVIARHVWPAVMHGCDSARANMRVLNLGEAVGPFRLEWVLAPATGFGGTFLAPSQIPGLASGQAIDTTLTLALDETHLATDLTARLEVDSRLEVLDLNRSDNLSILRPSHAVPDLRTLAQVSLPPSPQARVRFGRSIRDSATTLSPITQYEVYRRPEGALALTREARELRARAARAAGMRSDPSLLALGWDFVGAVPAHAVSEYSAIVPLLPDVPSPSGYQAFLVRAATATPSLYFDSCVDSLPQVDSLPPAVPANLRIVSVNGAGDVALAWDAVTSADLRRYRVHRGASPDFLPTTQNLVALPVQARLTDPGAGSGGQVAWYKIAAEDLVGNHSPFALAGTGTVGADGPPAPLRFALATPNPNPFTRELQVRFSLPADTRVTLSVYDIGGRLIRQAFRGVVLEAGQHEWRWDGRDARGGSAAPGVYLVRLQGGDRSATRRVLRME